MRNVFDQYQHPENRLTHALAVCLNEDRLLTEKFLEWAGAAPPNRPELLTIDQQSLPGDPPAEHDGEPGGLPDIVIHDGGSWCVLIESKIAAGLSADQLARHERTLRRRGFDRVSSVALTKAGVHTPPGVIARTWCGLYEWLGRSGGCREWAERLREYLRVAEVRLSRDGYLTEGTLTMFDGFPFTPDNPYTYGEAKRLLRVAVDELRRDGSLLALGVDPDAPGREQIRGGGSYVWDFLLLKDRPPGRDHTAHPHLTLALHVEHLEVAVSIPDRVVPETRRRLARLEGDAVAAMNTMILQNAEPLLGGLGSVEAFALQRHYRSQSSPPTVDARVSFKLDTAVPDLRGAVKHQPEWMSMFLSLLARKSSNIHFAYALLLPWHLPGLRTRDALRTIAQGWCALEPLLRVLRGDTQTRT